MSYKIIVAHPGRQHSFRTAVALKHHGMLCKYVTTVYDSNGSFLMNVLKKMISQKNLERAASRRTDALNEDDVVQFCELSGLIEIALYQIDKKRKIYRWWHNQLADRFGKKVARLAIREQADAVIMYDTTAKSCFELLEREAPRIVRIMDVSAANRLYMKRIYQKDEQICPTFVKKIKSERGHLYREKYCRRLSAEIKATQLFLVPSNFVKKSLEYSSVPPNRIFLCAYGTNFTPSLPSRDQIKTNKQRLQVLYVGNVTEMKGIYYLLQAGLHLQDKVEITLVGAFDNRDHLFDPYLKCCNFVGKISHNTVQDYMRDADVFVMPSLGEGFSLSILEAMACGLPCIVSENSGADSAIENGVNGFIIASQSAELIEEKLLWCCTNREKLPEMGRNACRTAMQFTWEEYEKRLVFILDSVLKKREKQCMD